MPLVSGRLFVFWRRMEGHADLAAAECRELEAAECRVCLSRGGIGRLALAAVARGLARLCDRPDGYSQLPGVGAIRFRARHDAAAGGRLLPLRESGVGKGAVARLAQAWTRQTRRRAARHGAFLASI